MGASFGYLGHDLPMGVLTLAEHVAELRVATARHAAAASRLEQAVARDERDARPPKPVIVVLEDQPAVRAAAVDALSRAFPGVTLRECETLAEARVALHDRPAVILADYYLGAGETSRDLLIHRDAAVRAFLYSGSVDLERVRTIGEDTGCLVLEKPITDAGWERLIAHVRRALDESGALRRASR